MLKVRPDKTYFTHPLKPELSQFGANSYTSFVYKPEHNLSFDDK